MLSGLLSILLIIVALVLVLLIIILQHGNEGGIGTAFGSGNSAGFFGASGGVTLIVRATWIAGILFFVLATSLAWVKTHEHFGVSREIDSALSTDPQVPPAAAPNAALTPAGAQPSAASSAPAAAPAAVATVAPVAPPAAP